MEEGIKRGARRWAFAALAGLLLLADEANAAVSGQIHARLVITASCEVSKGTDSAPVSQGGRVAVLDFTGAAGKPGFRGTGPGGLLSGVGRAGRFRLGEFNDGAYRHPGQLDHQRRLELWSDVDLAAGGQRSLLCNDHLGDQRLGRPDG